MSKPYGLIKSKSKLEGNSNFFQKKNIFDEDSDDEDESKKVSKGTDWVKSSMEAKKNKKQTQIAMTKALEEDSTVFQYDEVYDEIKEKREADAKRAKKDDQKKPKYINNLLKMAKVRERENERRIERKVQKERDEEGDEFKDKEVFVTSAYRKKMEEMQKLEEEEQRKEQLEQILDVRKQKDMSGFYRHLYRQTMGQEKGQTTEQGEKSDEGDDQSEDKKLKPDEVETVQFKKTETGAKNRQYRSRKQAEEPDDGDTDFKDSSSSDSSSESESKNPEKNPTQEFKKETTREEREQERRRKMKEDKERREKRKRKIEMGQDSSEDEAEPALEKNPVQEEQEGAKKPDQEVKKPKKVKTEKKPKLDIWNKITVGEVLEKALERYFKRKSERTGFPWVVA